MASITEGHFKIRTLTKQAKSYLTTQGDGRVVVTDGDSCSWYVKGIAGIPEDPPAGVRIQASSMGPLQVLATLEAPVEGDNLKGYAKVNPDASCLFGWDIFEEEGGYVITVAPGSLGRFGPLPESGKIYLVWNGEDRVKWCWSGGIVKQVPEGALWVFEKL